MTLGFPTDKGTIDSYCGTVVLELREALGNVQRVKAWLDSKTDAELTALAYTTDEVAALKSAFTDLNKLALIASAQGTQAQANDFFFFAKRLTGLR